MEEIKYGVEFTGEYMYDWNPGKRKLISGFRAW
jgi:hypothetical protein